MAAGLRHTVVSWNSGYASGGLVSLKLFWEQELRAGCCGGECVSVTDRCGPVCWPGVVVVVGHGPALSPAPQPHGRALAPPLGPQFRLYQEGIKSSEQKFHLPRHKTNHLFLLLQADHIYPAL